MLHNNLCVSILSPSWKGDRQIPGTLPLGKAAILAAEHGIFALFGDSLYRKGNAWMMDGQAVIDGKWVKVKAATPSAIYDRFPAQNRAAQYGQAMRAEAEIPISNPSTVRALCTDKLRCQRLLENAGIEMPPMEDSPDLFVERLRHWKEAFAKPRYGSLGRGIIKVGATASVPKQIHGVVKGRKEPTLLQKAICPPQGWAGCCIRVLAQRRPDLGWILRPPVLRYSKTDAVVNSARGSFIEPAEDLLPFRCIEEAKHLALSACKVLAKSPKGEWISELGLDLVPDKHYKPWLIEVNSRPLGRLGSLALTRGSRFRAIHDQSCLQPLIFIKERLSVA